MKNMKRIALVVAITLLLGCAIGGTLAWLTATDAPVVNTFSTSTIGVDFEETTTEYKMVPGWDIAKDPKAWVTAGSEDAILFVQVEESQNFDTFMTYAIADGWTLLNTNTIGTDINTVENDTYVIYRKVVNVPENAESIVKFPILNGNKVTVKGGVTKNMMTATDFSNPTMTFTVYASQLYKNVDVEFDAAEAWHNISDPTDEVAYPTTT